MAGNTGRYSDDPRLDKAMHWIMALGVVTSISLGGWFFRALYESVGTLGLSVTDLATEVKVLRVEREGSTNLLSRDIRELRERVVALESE